MRCRKGCTRAGRSGRASRLFGQQHNQGLGRTGHDYQAPYHASMRPGQIRPGNGDAANPTDIVEIKLQ